MKFTLFDSFRNKLKSSMGLNSPFFFLGLLRDQKHFVIYLIKNLKKSLCEFFLDHRNKKILSIHLCYCIILYLASFHETEFYFSILMYFINFPFFKFVKPKRVYTSFSIFINQVIMLIFAIWEPSKLLNIGHIHHRI